VCCANDTALPCFPSPLERVGEADQPLPAWPTPTYPKRSTLTAVGTFCQPATDATTVNAVLGLPGPGALVVPATATWSTPTPCTGDGGEVPAPY
jgi:hypothetical protein